jgi:hypothetical protein
VTAQERRLAIWRNLTPEERDYDRFVAGQIPQGASWLPETAWGRDEGLARRQSMISGDGECGGCSCHINPPCWHCENGHGDHETGA